MKSFIFKINDNGKADFIDQKDKAVYKRLLSSIKASGRNKFKITIDILDDSPKITNQQKNLFNVLISKISEYSGNDYDTVRNTLVENHLQGKNFNELNNHEFNDFLEKVIVFSNEFFNLNISFNSQTNHVEINKMY